MLQTSSQISCTALLTRLQKELCQLTTVSLMLYYSILVILVYINVLSILLQNNFKYFNIHTLLKSEFKFHHSWIDASIGQVHN